MMYVTNIRYESIVLLPDMHCKKLLSRQIAKLEVEEGISTERYLLNLHQLGVHCHQQHYGDLQIQTWIAKGSS